MNIYNLKKLLRQDIFDYRFRISSLIEEKSDLKEAIEDLEKNHITEKAKKLLYEKYRLLLNQYNIKEFLPTIKNDLFIVDTNLSIINNTLNTTINVYNALQFHQIVSPNLMDFIKNRLLKEKVNDVDIIKTMEFIKIHNSKCHEDQPSRISSADLYLVLNMLNGGYEEIKIEQVNNNKLEKVIKDTINALESNPISSIDDILHVSNLTTKEKEYVYKRILKYYQYEIYLLISALKDKDFYFNISILQTIKTEYKELYQKYMFIRNKLDELDKKEDKHDFKTEETKEETSIENSNMEENYLYYSSNNLGADKCFFVKDLENMREESYSTVLDLIKEFKSGNTKNLKYLSTNSNFMELKEDQVRIVLKPLGNKNYSVMGAFIKKSDNDRPTYENLFKRPVAKIDPEYSLQVENYYITFLEENKRKGSR